MCAFSKKVGDNLVRSDNVSGLSVRLSKTLYIAR